MSKSTTKQNIAEAVLGKTKRGTGILGGRNKVQEHFKKKTRDLARSSLSNKAIDAAFENDPVLRQFYGRSRQTKRTLRNANAAQVPLQIFHADLLIFSEERMIYSLTAICSYSRYAFIQPVASKKTQDMKVGFSRLLRQIKKFRKLPMQAKSLFYSDQGREFSLGFRNFVEKKGHAWKFAVASVQKAFFIEVFHRTLRRKLALLRYRKGTERYFRDGGFLGHYKLALESYNTTSHRGLLSEIPAEPEAGVH